MVKRGFVIIVINLLLIATVVSVWALWRNQPVGVAVGPAEQGKELLSAESIGPLPAQQQALYQRLEQRLLNNPDDFEAQLL